MRGKPKICVLFMNEHMFEMFRLLGESIREKGLAKPALLCLVLASMLAFSCGGNKNELRIEAQLDYPGDSVDVMTVDYGSTTVDRKRYALEDGHLDLTLPLEKPTSVSIRVPGDYYHYGIGFPGVPGEKVVVRGSFDDYTVNGSRFYQDYAAISDMLKPGYVKLGKMREDFENLYKELVKDREKNADRLKAEKERYHTEYEAVNRDLKQKVYDFVAAHPDQDASVSLLNSIDPNQMEDVVASLNPKVANGRMKPVIDALRKQAENERIRQEAVESIKEGIEAPDFTLPDIEGKSFTLSSMRGKWVILDFWGSWCGWCIKGIPDMKKHYEKYAGKFEIVGIDCRDTQEKWKAAVEKYELPWLHVYNADADGTPDKYAIPGYPTKIIIDPDGNINKILVGESEEFYKYLDTLFGE